MVEWVDPQQEKVAQIGREVREWAEEHIIGAVEAGVWFVQAQERAARWAERINAEPLDARLRFLAFLTGNKIEEADVTGVTFACEVEPLEDDPTHFAMVYRADVKLARSIEAVYVKAKLGVPE